MGEDDNSMTMPDSTLSPKAPVFQQTSQYVYPPSPVASGEVEISFLDLWRILLRGKWLIVLSTALCTAAAVYSTQTTIPIYRAEVIMISVAQDGDNRGGLFSQYAGLAAMAGTNIGGGGGSTNVSLAILKSRTFIESFLRDEKLLPVLFPGRMDSVGQDLKADDPRQTAILCDAAAYFSQNILKVVDDPKTGLITLAIEWTDREKTAQWANLLAERINTYLRMLAVREARDKIEYLQDELSKTNIVELRQAIANLLESQIKMAMLPGLKNDFSFTIIDRALVPPEGAVIWPRRRVTIVVGAVIGVFLGIVAAFLKNLFR